MHYLLSNKKPTSLVSDVLSLVALTVILVLSAAVYFLYHYPVGYISGWLNPVAEGRQAVLQHLYRYLESGEFHRVRQQLQSMPGEVQLYQYPSLHPAYLCFALVDGCNRTTYLRSPA
jgi:hypothetical protein